MKKNGLMLVTVILFGICMATEQSWAAEAVQIPPVNVITAKGEAVQPAAEIFYSSNDQRSYGKTAVVWEEIEPTVFQQSGRYEIEGRTASDGQQVKGYLNVLDKPETINISVVGDSITASNWGGLLPYPAQLENRLGTAYRVSNFGHSGASLSWYSGTPYRLQQAFARSKQTSFDAMIIQLGTNDAWQGNWGKIKASFKDEYIALIKEYQAMEPEGVIYLCLPPEIWLSSSIGEMRLQILQVVQAFADDPRVSVIDNHTPTKEEWAYYSDGLHPNSKGLATLSHNIYETIHGKTVSDLDGAFSTGHFSQATHIVSAKEQEDFYLDQIANGEWVLFEHVDFSRNQGEIALVTAQSGNIGGNVQVEIRLDALDGPIIAEGALRREGSWQTSAFYNETVSGKHNVYITFKHPWADAYTSLVKFKAIDFAYQDDTAELLKNGDFEAGLNYWSGANQADYGVDNYDTYQQSQGKLWIYSNTSFDRTVQQTVTGLADGIYTVSAMVKRTTPGGTARMELTTASGDPVIKPVNVNSGYEAIQQVVEVKQGTLKIAFRYKDGAGGLVVDNVSLAKDGSLPAENYLRNGDFELDNNYWESSGDGRFGIDDHDKRDSYDGQRLWIYNGFAFDRSVYQSVTGLTDGIYTVSAMVKRTTSGGTARLELSTGADEITIKPINVANGFQEIRQVVEVKAGKLQVAFRYKDGGGGLVVDDVRVEKGGTLPASNYLSNGDFEWGLQGWQSTGSGYFGVDVNDAFEGQKLWLYSGTYFDRTVYQVLEDLPAGEYTLTAQVKRTTNGGAAQLEVTTDGLAQRQAITVKNGYQEIRQVLTVKEGTVKVAFRYYNGAGGMQVDNVTLTRNK